MTIPRRKKSTPEDKPGHSCDWPGCGVPAPHPAPKSTSTLRDYYWFCLDHIRLYNEAWNYFNDMQPDEVERFKKEAVTGHRPTWKIGMQPLPGHSDFGKAVYDSFLGQVHNFFETPVHHKPEPPITPEQKRALAVFDLEYPVTKMEIKVRYKELVKKHHPDLNSQDSAAEEKFKKVNEAYKALQNL